MPDCLFPDHTKNKIIIEMTFFLYIFIHFLIFRISEERGESLKGSIVHDNNAGLSNEYARLDQYYELRTKIYGETV